jgi:branched-chain amino acid transport system permease protein
MSALGLRRTELVALLALVVGVVTAPLLLAGDPFLVGLVGFTLAFAIFAMGLHVMLGWAGEIPLGLALFYGLGAYASAMLMKDAEMPFVLATLIAMAIAAVLALGIGLVTLRLSGAYFSIVSWGLAAVAVIVATNLDDVTGGALGLFGIPLAEIGPISLVDPSNYLWVCGGLMVLVVVVLAALRRSAFGIRVNGGRLNRHLAESVGANVYADKVQAFVLSGTLAALSGALSVTYLSIVTPGTLAVTLTVEALVMVLLGGSGFLLGPVLGALFFKLVPEWIHLDAEIRTVIFAALIILIMMTAPGGLPDVINRLRGLRPPRRRPLSGSPPGEVGGVPAAEQVMSDPVTTSAKAER